MDYLKMPKILILGAAMAAAQVEGAIPNEGRSPTIPDVSSVNQTYSTCLLVRV
jgi:beta-glucosidase/6-phospho-beta-glucosidase/beta-galactosidase